MFGQTNAITNTFEKVTELKALLFHNKNTLKSFTFVPTRTVTWKGDIVAYKIRPLLSDENGCLTIRILPEDMQPMIDMAQKDQDLLVRQTNTRLFNVESIPKYEISLSPDLPVSTPTLESPRISLHRMPTEPIEKRCEPDWRENEGYPASTVVEEVGLVRA